PPPVPRRKGVMAIPSTHVSLLRELEEGGASQGEAWAAFHARYREVILRWCRGRGVPRTCAEDLTQEAFLLLSQRPPNVHHEPARGRFRSWLQPVVHTVVTDFWRRQRRRPECVGVADPALLDRLADVAASPVESDEPAASSSRLTAAEILDRV